MSVIDNLPQPSSSRLAIRVTPDALRQIRSGHPWLYEGSIRSVSREGAPGDLAVVFDDDRRFAAIGLWDPLSPIRVKVLHCGSPITIDGTWFRGVLEAALARRHPLVISIGTEKETTAYRVVNGESDGLPSMVIDRYSDVVVMKLYSAAWIPHLAALVSELVALLNPTSIVLRLARNMREIPLHGLVEGASLFGPDVTEPVRFREVGLTFEADVVQGQKTGHFLDQRDNRARVGELAARSRVLDVFCCTGGFSVHAAAGGAHAVLGIDSSPGALASAKHNFTLNAHVPLLKACHHETVCAEAYGEMERLIEARRRFDVVVIDPPSFAQNAASVPRALAAYERLTTLGIALLDRGGTLVQASCSSRVSEADFFRTVHLAAARAGVDLDEIERTGHALDHPVTFAEGAYLKTLFARVVPLREARRAASTLTTGQPTNQRAAGPQRAG